MKTILFTHLIKLQKVSLTTDSLPTIVTSYQYKKIASLFFYANYWWHSWSIPTTNLPL